VSFAVDAPLLDIALALAVERQYQDPDELSVELALAGITRDAFSLPGLCEAARRFGRHRQWRVLVRYLAANRGAGRRPRPFESWFELDVFLFLDGLGFEAQPQRKVGRYRVDLLLPELVPPLVIECDGDGYHTGERADRDRDRERQLQAQGYQVLRVKSSDFKGRPEVTRRAIAQELERLKAAGSQLKLA